MPRGRRGYEGDDERSRRSRSRSPITLRDDEDRPQEQGPDIEEKISIKGTVAHAARSLSQGKGKPRPAPLKPPSFSGGYSDQDSETFAPTLDKDSVTDYEMGDVINILSKEFDGIEGLGSRGAAAAGALGGGAPAPDPKGPSEYGGFKGFRKHGRED